MTCPLRLPGVCVTTVNSRYLEPVESQIREPKLSISPFISRFRVQTMTRDLPGHRPTLWCLQLLISMLSNDRGTYISRISVHIDIASAKNHNKPLDVW